MAAGPVGAATVAVRPASPRVVGLTTDPPEDGVVPPDPPPPPAPPPPDGDVVVVEGAGAGPAGGATDGGAPAPKAQPSTLPGAGLYDPAPTLLYCHEPPGWACQYDQ